MFKTMSGYSTGCILKKKILDWVPKIVKCTALSDVTLP